MKFHILLLVTDQFRHDVVSPEITPNLDRWMNGPSASTRPPVWYFENAYSSTPTCTPARAGLLTGKSPWAHGMLGFARYTDCTKYPTTLPNMLQELANYSTATIGKNHFGPNTTQGYQTAILYDGGMDRQDDYYRWFNETLPNMDPLATCSMGFNEWKSCPYYYEEYAHPTAWTTRTALSYLQDYFEQKSPNRNSTSSSASPLFLKVSYHRPHSPYDPPRRLLEQYLPGGPKSNIPQMKRNLNHDWDVIYQNTTGPMANDAWNGDPGETAARHSRAGYLANVQFVDEGVGKILDYVDRLMNTKNDKDEEHDFLILWTSDHGDQNGDLNLWRKSYAYEASAHVPMLIRPPRVAQHHKPYAQYQGENKSNLADQRKTTGALVENRDIAPTIYDMVGIYDKVQALDPIMNGKSLVPILQGDQGGVRDWLDLEHSICYFDQNHWNAIVGYDGNDNTFTADGSSDNNHILLWKYIYFAHDGSEQLFCLSTDPKEARDLSNDSAYQSILQMWRQRLVDQFETEGRGDDWVKNGKLQIRTKSTVFGPNYPCLKEETITVT